MEDAAPTRCGGFIKHQRDGELRRQTADGVVDVRGKLRVTAWKGGQVRRRRAGCSSAQHCHCQGNRAKMDDGAEAKHSVGGWVSVEDIC